MRVILLVVFALFSRLIQAQSYTYEAGSTNNPNPAVTACQLGSTKTQVCFGIIKKVAADGKQSRVRVICKGTPSKECPSANECFEEYDQNMKANKITGYDLTGNNQASGSGPSVPAKKKCKFSIPNNVQISIKQRVNVVCGTMEMYVDGDQSVDEFKFKNFTLKPSDFPDIPINAGTMGMALTGKPMVVASKIRDLLKQRGVTFSDIGISSEANPEFSYTPKSKDDKDQIKFYVSPSGDATVSVCTGSSNQGCFMESSPAEYQLPYCDESLILGQRFCGRNREVVGCFAAKDELYCVDAIKCGEDKYSSNPFVFGTPTKINPNPRESSNRSSGSEQ
jgi:hypothetical protein